MTPSDLASNFLAFLKNLKEQQAIKNWRFTGSSDIRYNTPIGPWQEDGFLFHSLTPSYSYILRSVIRPADGVYKIVIESVNLEGQLYNIDLTKKKTHLQQNSESHLLESYDMTIGHGRTSRETVREAFEKFGYYGNEISVLSDTQQDWEAFTADLLNWAIKRERVKASIKDEKPPFDAERKTASYIVSHNNKLNSPLNQILYGPPGTGKTYLTIEKAVAIVDGLDDEDLAGKTREDLKSRFEELKQMGQIVFCTFHQSMSYEDFIEGIKPVLGQEVSEDNISYRIEDGIFKRLCVRGTYELKISGSPRTGQELSEIEKFNAVYEEFLSQVEDKLATGQAVELQSITGLKLYITDISELLNLRIKHDGEVRERPYIVSRQRLIKLFTYFESIDAIKNVHKDIRGVIGGANTTAYWAVLSELYKIAKTKSGQSQGINQEKESEVDYETMKLLNSDGPVVGNNISSKRFLIIIDEINRGNVSQIFGELISLIEDDKRLGASEALEATLPYSKEKFGVPSNLYIIGTMNTADRSVEALDTALRRRFSFQEIFPNPEVLEKDIEGFPLKDILKTINKRIEKLLDRDHLIGHSYFLVIQTLFDLQLTFQNKIIPLLQEYFFGDYGKIGLVLGQGFVTVEEISEPNLFAKFEYSDSEAFSERPVYTLQNASAMSDEAFVDALKLLMNK